MGLSSECEPAPSLAPPCMVGLLIPTPAPTSPLWWLPLPQGPAHPHPRPHPAALGRLRRSAGHGVAAGDGEACGAAAGGGGASEQPLDPARPAREGERSTGGVPDLEFDYGKPVSGGAGGRGAGGGWHGKQPLGAAGPGREGERGMGGVPGGEGVRVLEAGPSLHCAQNI